LKETDASKEPSANNLKELRRAKDRPVAFLEHEIELLGKLLESFRVDTKANVERRAALTDKERQQEIEEYEEREAKERLEAERQAEIAANGGGGTGGAGGGNGEAGEEDEDDEARIYNPLKLPLGWDGKPIPYWLYKLHGLGVEYKCEICSDFVYMGR
jgi:splicing factor 3A subunit 3